MHNFGFLFAGKDGVVRHTQTRNGLVLAIVFLFVFLSPLSCNDASSTGGNQPKSTTRKSDLGFDTIVAVGDSVTAGYGVDEAKAYPALLENRLLLDGYFFNVINAGISGETSSGALSRIEWVIGSLNPDIVILETGANDGLRGVDPTVIEKNIDKIVTTLRKNGIGVLLAGMRMPTNLGPDYTTRFADVYTIIAEKYDIPLMPFFLESVAGDAHYNLPDGMHPNAEGYQLILDDIYPYVLEVIKGRGE